jgi:pimeloyl-ACP methyl ester carboxylesterase
MSTVDMADDLEALREHLNLAEVSVLGHSNGGAIALSYAERYPTHVSKLVLIDSQVLGLSAAKDSQRILQERSTDPRFEEALKIVSGFFSGQTNPATSDESLETFVSQTLPLFLYSPEKNLPEARKHMLGPISSYAFLSQYAADASFIDQTKLLDQIKAKTLIIAGKHDYICPVALSARLHQGILQSQLVLFEKSGHMPWIEERDTFFAVLNDFLAS